MPNEQVAPVTTLQERLRALSDHDSHEKCVRPVPHRLLAEAADRLAALGAVAKASRLLLLVTHPDKAKCVDGSGADYCLTHELYHYGHGCPIGQLRAALSRLSEARTGE